MNTITLDDEGTAFSATSSEAFNPVRLVLFASGSGGNPERHLPLLKILVENNCSVIAPHFERIMSPSPTSAELLHRARRLQIALNQFAVSDVSVVGIGHSIGATLLLALAGGKMWMRAGDCLAIPSDERLKKLVLFAPTMGFFQAPNALAAIQIPLQAWAGTLDKMTPPAQIEFLRDSLSVQVSLDLQIIEGASHFSFMNSLPPQITDSMANRDDFLKTLAADVCRFTLT